MGFLSLEVERDSSILLGFCIAELNCLCYCNVFTVDTYFLMDRQKSLEDSLLVAGQFKDALQLLLDWLYKVEPSLNEDQPVHGDIDTVNNLIDQHRASTKSFCIYWLCVLFTAKTIASFFYHFIIVRH